MLLISHSIAGRSLYPKPKQDKAMSVRAKFNCHYIQHADDNSSITVHMGAVTTGSEENKAWSKLTPGGLVSMHISNPDAFGLFEQGKEYFIDIAPVE